MTTAGMVRERNLPRKFLESILCELKSAGIVKSKKGKHGGYILARHPGDISIRDVVEALEGDQWLKCSHAEKGQSCKSCKSVDKCIVNLVAHSIRSHVSDWFANHSIVHIAAQEEETLLTTVFQ